MPNLEFKQKGDLRWAIVRFLYERQARAPWPEDAIVEHLNRERMVTFEVELSDLREAVAFLAGMKMIADAGLNDPLNVERRWQIAPDGVIAYERSRA